MIYIISARVHAHLWQSWLSEGLPIISRWHTDPLVLESFHQLQWKNRIRLIQSAKIVLVHRVNQDKWDEQRYEIGIAAGASKPLIFSGNYDPRIQKRFDEFPNSMPVEGLPQAKSYILSYIKQYAPPNSP